MQVDDPIARGDDEVCDSCNLKFAYCDCYEPDEIFEEFYGD
jgi:hypothetical protein